MLALKLSDLMYPIGYKFYLFFMFVINIKKRAISVNGANPKTELNKSAVCFL